MATMAKSRFTHDQIMAVVLEMNAERKPKDVARKYGVSTTTLYRWRARFAEDEPSVIGFVHWRLKIAGSKANLLS